jgi:class 3 adenylate cyclase/tetratricopeptide (TPR) repeat protein
MSCGQPLERRCPSCGAEQPPGGRFCIECGTQLDEGAPAPTAPQAEIPQEERRLVTVLFADLSGYTAIAERMDPEAAKGLVDRALRRLGEEVTKFGGSVDKYIGDNVMAVFGAPVAHEDDPERAVRAGLAMQDAMEDVNERAPEDVNFLLRVGLNTGEVLAGEVGGGYTVIGDTVNVAARLQAAARPGTVTVGEPTHRATQGAIRYEALEPLELKGKSEPVPAFEATGMVAEGPVHRAGPRSETPLVGREDESALLGSLFERVRREESPHLVTLIGEPGVGKSRLLREFREQLAALDQPPDVREGQCPPYGSAIAYWAVGEIVRTELGILDDDSPEAALEKVRSGLAKLRVESAGDAAEERNAALIARLIGIEVPGGGPELEDDDPQRIREALFSATRVLIEGMAQRHPLVLVFEDIHWADEGTLDLIEYLARWVRAPALIVCLARDDLLERRQGWGGGRRNATSISLEPLSVEETRNLVAALYGDGNGAQDGGATSVAAAVAERAGGNPLFAEEMVNRLRERGEDDPEALPENVQSLLAARLDSLGKEERRLLQHAAVVGRIFWEGSLSAVAKEHGIDVPGALGSLRDRDLVVASAGSRIAGEREYAFKHVLIRDVAYGMLPRAVRCRKHFDVAGFIEEQAGERAEAVVPLLAEHYGRAAALAEAAELEASERERIDAKALHFLEAAGDAAAALYSNQEAYAQYSAALELEGLDADTRARIGEKQGDVGLRMGRVDAAIEVWERCLAHHRGQEDLARVGDLHRKIGAALWHKGERSDAIEHYQKGIDLLKDGPPCLELVALYGEAASLYMHTGDNMLAIYAAEKALRLAERLGEARAASRAHGIFGRVFGRIGDGEKARENLERSVELARDSDQAEAVRALATLGSHLEVSEADYEGAAGAYTEALELATRVGDLPSQVELHAALAQLASYKADWDQVERSTNASQSLAEREGLVGKLCFPFAMRGMLHWRNDDWEGAEESFRRAHEIAEQVGRSEVAFTALMGLAISQGGRAKYGDALATLARAEDICERAGMVAQSIEAVSSRAVALALAGRTEDAQEAADEATRLTERVHYPAGKASAREAVGVAEADPKALDEARAAWEELGRPLDAMRCQKLLEEIELQPGGDTGS